MAVKKVCLGCGSTRTDAQCRREQKSCCPDRKLVHPEYAKGYDAGYQSGYLNAGGSTK